MTARHPSKPSGRRRAAGRESQVRARSGSGVASRDAIAFKPAAVRRASPREYAARFVLGAAISVVAGLVGMRFGPRAGGVFLAFPAILPASLTLLESHEGEGAADADAQGGILGGVGMVLFAVAVATLVKSLGAPLALAIALAAWVLGSAGLYLVMRATWRHAWA